MKEIPVRRLRERHPDRVLRAAVHGMLPKNRSRHSREDRLVLLAGDAHPHAGQVAANPWKLSVADGRTFAPPRPAGYYVRLSETEEALLLEQSETVAESTREGIGGEDEKSGTAQGAARLLAGKRRATRLSAQDAGRQN